MIDVKKDFGAVGDGVADDTIPIQSALNQGYDTIRIPAGTYKVGALFARRACRITGEGQGVTTLQHKIGDTGDTLTTQADVEIERLVIDCNSRRRLIAQGNALRIEGANNTIRRVGIFNPPLSGVVLVPGVTGTLIDNCDIRAASLLGIWMQPWRGFANTIIRGCNIIHNGAGVECSGDGVTVDCNTIVGGTAGSAAIYPAVGYRNLKITNNTIRNSGSGVDTGNAPDSTDRSNRSYGSLIAGNVCECNYIDGISLTTNGYIVANNQICDNGGGGAQNFTLLPVLIAQGGSGYKIDDIVKVAGGTLKVGGSPASFRVQLTDNGSLSIPDTPGSAANIYMGDYSVMPPLSANTVAVTGSGSGATVRMGGVIIAARGSGYEVGDFLVLSGGQPLRPAKFRVESVGDSQGEVLSVSIHDGGVYGSDFSVNGAATTTKGGGYGCTLSTHMFKMLGSQAMPSRGVAIVGCGHHLINGNKICNRDGLSIQRCGVMEWTGAIGSNLIVGNDLLGNADYGLATWSGTLTKGLSSPANTVFGNFGDVQSGGQPPAVDVLSIVPSVFPQTGVEGQIRFFKNSSVSTNGAIVAGGGVRKVLACYTRGKWRVVV